MKSFILSFILFFSLAGTAQKTPYLLVGTYDSPASNGMYVYSFDPKSGHSSQVGNAETSNPSYQAVSADGKFVYSVNEKNPGFVSSWSFNKTNGQLKAINTQRSQGADPCYVAIDRTGKWVVVGNYSSGTLALFAIRSDGGLDSAKQVIEHTGYSVNSERQEGPHVHCTLFSHDNKYLLVSDLGTDKIMIYTFDARQGQLHEAAVPFVMTQAGAGPRHLDFHPNGKFLYLMEELSGSISVYYYKNGSLELLQNQTALPGNYDGPVGSADIHVSPDGKFLYASNRGESNTIAIFRINQKTGWLQPVAHQSTLGKIPRNFNFDPTGNFLLVANQDSNEIVIFSIDHKTGLLTDTGNRIKVGKPVCIKWIRR